MNEAILATIVAVLAASLRLATPYLSRRLGEMFAQRSGVLNLGVDGIMLVGAFVRLLRDVDHRERLGRRGRGDRGAVSPWAC